MCEGAGRPAPVDTVRDDAGDLAVWPSADHAKPIVRLACTATAAR
jgi:hypothetical protein